MNPLKLKEYGRILKREIIQFVKLSFTTSWCIIYCLIWCRNGVKYEYIGKIYFKICFKNRLLMRMKKVNQLFYEKHSRVLRKLRGRE